MAHSYFLFFHSNIYQYIQRCIWLPITWPFLLKADIWTPAVLSALGVGMHKSWLHRDDWLTTFASYGHVWDFPHLFVFVWPWPELDSLFLQLLTSQAGEIYLLCLSKNYTYPFRNMVWGSFGVLVLSELKKAGIGIV